MSRFRRIDPTTGEITPSSRPRDRRPKRRTPSPVQVRCDAWDWFPLQVRSGKEGLAQVLLEDRGFATFVPRRVKWRNRNRFDKARRKKQQIAYPWLPGLLIVGMRAPYPWHRLDIGPVLHIVATTQGAVRPMVQDAVWRLMKEFGSGQFVAPDHERWMGTNEEFDVGDTVSLREGPLADVPFRVKSISGNTATVFREFFGADRGFDVDLVNLRPFGL